MQATATNALIVIAGAILALWPVAFLVAAALHGLARRWRHVGQIAWLLPLWSIAASIGLVQFPRLLKAFEPSAPPGPTLVAITAAVFALCCAGVAWALLLRSFASDHRSGTLAP
jgi:hypothetical protein